MYALLFSFALGCLFTFQFIPVIMYICWCQHWILLSCALRLWLDQYCRGNFAFSTFGDKATLKFIPIYSCVVGTIYFCFTCGGHVDKKLLGYFAMCNFHVVHAADLIHCSNMCTCSFYLNLWTPILWTV